MGLSKAFWEPSGEGVHLSLKRIAAAQVAALVAGFPLALMILFPLGAAIEALGRAGLPASWVRFASLFLSYFAQSASLSLIQFLVLRRGISHPLEFVVGGGLAGVALFPLLYPASYWLASALRLPVTAAGLPVGMIFGLLLALVQCYWMSAGRRPWLVISALAWAVAWPLICTLVHGTLGG